MAPENSTILITGGAGFIGSALVRNLLTSSQLSIVNLDKLTYAGNRCSLDEVLDDPRHNLVEGDVADGPLVANLLAQHQPKAVIHLAAESHVDRSISHPPQFATTNVVGTCTLLDVTTHYWQQLDEVDRRSFRFLFVSSDEVFGSASGESKFDEESRLLPNSPYSASKAAGEHFARAFAQTYGLPVVTTNPSNNYGPRQHPEKFIPRMILCAAERKPLPVYGDGLQERDWLHVDDCCRALIEILGRTSCSSRYLIGSDNCLSNLCVAEKICDLVDDMLADGTSRRELIASVADRPGHDRRYAVDSRRLQNETSWRPQIGFEAGLRETVRWYLNHSDWVTEVLKRAEQ